MFHHPGGMRCIQIYQVKILILVLKSSNLISTLFNIQGWYYESWLMLSSKLPLKCESDYSRRCAYLIPISPTDNGGVETDTITLVEFVQVTRASSRGMHCSGRIHKTFYG